MTYEQAVEKMKEISGGRQWSIDTSCIKGEMRYSGFLLATDTVSAQVHLVHSFADLVDQMIDKVVKAEEDEIDVELALLAKLQEKYK